MKSKKAISAVVATVLLVLITIAAVGIIWGAIMPIIRQNIETSQKCLNAGIEVNTEAGYTYVAGSNVSIQISRGASTIDVSSIQLKIIDSTGNSNITTRTDVPPQNTDKVYMLDAAQMGLQTPKKVGVAPVISIGKTTYTCPMKEVEIPV